MAGLDGKVLAMTRAATSRLHPRSHAICDRCGFRYNHDDLQWQYQWAGPRLQNLRLLVCKTCLDIPQEQLRTIVLPPDPVPIANPRPENYINANNPNSPVGQAPTSALSGSNIGTLIQSGGTYSAFIGSTSKPFAASATLTVSGTSFANWLGKDWSAPQAAVFLPTTIDSSGLALMVTGFTAVAPSNAPFLASGTTNYAFQGSSNASTWTTLASGTTSSASGQTISTSNLGGTAYRYHRFVLAGNGTAAAVAYLAINTDRGYSLSREHSKCIGVRWKMRHTITLKKMHRTKCNLRVWNFPMAV